ncbi:MAG: fatty acid cis/trans isomerase [Thiohalomonadales bacterium]
MYHKISLLSRIHKFIISLFLLLLIVSCSTALKNYEELYGPSSPKNRVLSEQEVAKNTHISFTKEVRPVLVQRCAVCHSCNDAPCQINFTSIEGIDRGSSTQPVYNGARFFAQEPTRLGIDASTTSQWREKEFRPILNERRQNEQVNLNNSLLYKVLTAKRAHEFTTEGRLSEKYNIGTELIDSESFVHSQTCPDVESYTAFAQNNPQWGMPFALPQISLKEFKTIETWLEQGAYVEPEKQLSQKLQNQVNKWERFLNNTNNKQKLMARYLYEHLFAGHLYFEDVSKKDFFMLVRSKTQPGQVIDIINTIRPYNDPGVDQFYYRLKRYTRTIVDKTHMPYALSDKRMKRYKELFLKPRYIVFPLPSYEQKLSANPFKTYAKIPAKSRYQFLLDDALYFISNFIKGPVCRGSIALSVIDDHFWVVFMDPDKSPVSQDSKFLVQVSDELRLPSELEDNASLLSVWYTYTDVFKDYIYKKLNYYDTHLNSNKGFSIEQIWNGNKKNDNAALTVYRHYDSATVLKGFVGEIPKTGWVIDYPIFERIYYLLAAGFNVYGKVGHQLSTRLYMDFLRVEAELSFLAFLPSENRVKIHKQWYRKSDVTEKIVKALSKGRTSIVHESQIKYETNDVKKEFFVKINKHLQKAQSNRGAIINHCLDLAGKCKPDNLNQITTKVQKALQKLGNIHGLVTAVFPDVTFMRIKVDGSIKNDLVYTVVRNKSFLNTTSLGINKDKRVPEEDTIDIIPGFVGSYPNFFMVIEYSDINKFVEQYKLINGLEKYELLVNKYGIRRTAPDFWQYSDWFYKKYKHDYPVSSGLFDLNRYKNR